VELIIRNKYGITGGGAVVVVVTLELLRKWMNE
jgi:hypothetical protein